MNMLMMMMMMMMMDDDDDDKLLDLGVALSLLAEQAHIPAKCL